MPTQRDGAILAFVSRHPDDQAAGPRDGASAKSAFRKDMPKSKIMDQSHQGKLEKVMVLMGGDRL